MFTIDNGLGRGPVPVILAVPVVKNKGVIETGVPKVILPVGDGVNDNAAAVTVISADPLNEVPLIVLAVAKVVAVEALPVKAPVNPVDVTDVKPAIVVLLAPNAVEVLPIVIDELTKFELATVADAMSVPVIVPSTIIVEFTLPDPIAATPPVPIVISPDTPA